MFTDGTDMFVIAVGDNGASNGNWCFRFQLSDGPGSTLTSTQIGSTVLPSYLRPGGVNGNADEFRWYSFLDNHTDPQNPCIHLWVQDDDNTQTGNYSYYRWNGPNAMISTGYPGPNAGLALPHTKCGGGERIWSPQQANIEIVSRAPIENGQCFSFKVYGDAGTVVKRVRFFYGLDHEAATNPVSIRVGSVCGGGAILGVDSVGDYIDEVIADGTTIYNFVWETVEDGVQDSDYALIMPVVEAT